MKPGIHSDVPEAEYHADPAISYSGLKVILDCPARYAWEREHGRPEKAAYDFGHAAHAKVLGVGMDVVVVDADSWRTKAAQEQRDEAYAAGKVPILTADAARVDALAEAVLAHPAARFVLELEGEAEVSVGWSREVDGMTVDLRSRIDRATAWPDGMPLLLDLKSAVSAAPRRFASSVFDYSYHVQDAVYRDGWAEAAGVTNGLVDFLFVVVEKEPPHLTAVYRLDDTAVEVGQRRYLDALTRFVTCTREDHWPAYGDDVTELKSPGWVAA